MLIYCLYACYILFTTLCNFRGHFSAFRSEMQRVRLATRRAINDDQAPGGQRVQAMTDIALIMSQRLHQFSMTHGDHSIGALILREQASQDMALQP